MRPILLLTGVSLAAVLLQPARAAQPGYVTHEWGTFTSVQGGDGVPLYWQSPQVAELPDFVYNWKKPGLSRFAVLGLKPSLTALQRMETPVLYFYADAKQTVDVTVQFPRGSITEWYPQAYQVGPAMSQTTNGAIESSEFAVPDSRIRWSGVNILPGTDSVSRNQNQQLPLDLSGSHYFAARETDAALLSLDALTATNPPEREKFLFYRGIGNFATPLKVKLETDGELTVTNTGSQALPHLFALNIRQGAGTLAPIVQLAPGESRVVSLEANLKPIDVSELARQVATVMADALVSEGLYPREATAMVDTWKDSWFTEDGVRVLYILPRPWTDDVLPLTLVPPPRELVRVMVGRAEIITPTMASELFNTLNAAQSGDDSARTRAAIQLEHLGRFAEPALRLATLRSSATNEAALGYQLLSRAASRKP